MKNKFLLGAASGAAALIVAVPLLAQFSSAASNLASPEKQVPASSVQVPDTKEVPDAQEAASLTAVAKITPQAAEQAALAVHAGKVHGNALENMGGSVVYKIEISDQGKEFDVIVDAGNGKVLDNHEDGADHHGRDANEADEHDGKDTGEVRGADDANETGDKADANEQDETNDGTTSSAAQATPAAR